MTVSNTAPRRMRRTLARTLFAGAAFTAIATGAFAEDARLNDVIFDVTPTPFAAQVQVVSNGGDKWDQIQKTEIAFDARIKIDTKGSGYVEQYAVFLGACSNPSCGSHPKVLWESVARRDMDRSGTIRFWSTELTDTKTGDISVTYGKKILDLCNQKPVDQAHGFRLSVNASMSANTRKAVDTHNVVGPEVGAGFNGGDVNRTDQFEIDVSCLANKKSTVERKPDPHRTKPDVVDSINLFLTTYKVPETGPRGTTCKPLKVTTRIETGEAGLKNVKLWRQVNGGPITSEQKQMHADDIGGGKFGDDWDKVEHFTKTTTVQYKAEMLGGTFAPSTPWKSITIHCNGDYAPTPPTSTNPDVPPRGKPQAELPPTIVTPPPACGTKAAKVRGAPPCIKVAPTPDQRQQWADQKRKQAEDKRRAAKDAELRRREAAMKEAELERRQMIHRPVGFGRFGGPGRFGGSPHMRPGFVVRPGLILR